jgi:LuxR family transcriptional regulator, maltose regulon positive regulatory protein
MATDIGVEAVRRRRQAVGAADPVLMAKITGHSLPAWAVPRPRIDQLIAAGAGGPLTVVTGPPGAGKTMAIASWAAGHTGPGTIVWITVDEYDNRPHVFWSYVVAALRQAGIAVPRAGLAAAANDADGHMFLLRLASALAVPGPPVIMVIEDLHLLTDADTLDGLAYILKNSAPSLRLVISSRIDPLLPLHRYRLAGELTEIRAEDLAFSVSESRLVMAQHDITLSAQALESLVERTEGWAAGIRLAAISLDGHPDPEQFVKEFGAEDSAVTGYLVDEVLTAQPASVRDFLLRTSILDRVSADVARELSDDQQPDLLPALAHSNAFIRPVGHGWYRYHPLFAAILRLKLRSERPGQLSDLHRRAARWYLRTGHLTEAVRHAGAAGDWPSAARMVLDELAMGALIEPHGNQSLAEEFRRMPAGLTWAQPQPLIVAAAIDLSSARDGLATTSLSAAEGILARLPAGEEVPARLAAALVRMALSRQTGDLDAAVTASARAETLLGQIPERLLALHPEIRVQVLLAHGVVQLWAGNLSEAAMTFKAGLANVCDSATTLAGAECRGHLALVEALRGRLSRAVELAAQTAGAAANDDDVPRDAATSAASAALAYTHVERNQLRQAHRQLTVTDATLTGRPDKLISAMAGLIAARSCLAEGRARPALELLGRARRGWSSPRWLERRLTLVESSACAASGDPQSAIDAAGRADTPATPDVAAALARAWLAAGDHQAARRALATADTGSGDQPEPGSLEGWLVDARLSYGSGDGARGRRSLERALRLGQPELLRLPFVMERAWIRPVLRRDPSLARPYQHLLGPDLVGPDPWPAAHILTRQAAPLVVEQLSQREQEVLLRLSGMLSTVEIAGEMYISVNTVKTHLKSIYRKLSAGHRGEAVRRARQLKLILPSPPSSGRLPGDVGHIPGTVVRSAVLEKVPRIRPWPPADALT